MDEPAADAELDALVEALALKATVRAGWTRVGVSEVESVAAHSWGVAWLVLLLLPAELDRERALTYALLHDLAEARIGDITPHDGVSRQDKARREAEAMRAMTPALPRGAELEATWHAYEAQEDDEARFVKQLDRLDMALQALAYARDGQARPEELVQFVDSAARKVSHSTLRAVLERIRERLAEE